MRALLAVLALVTFVDTLSADSIILRSGKSLRGEIVAQHPDRVEIKLPSGEVRTVPRSEIVSVRKDPRRLVQFRERRAALKDGDVAGLLELAAWCETQNMRRQRIQVLREAVKADPDCAEARRALGKVWTGSQWRDDEAKGVVSPPRAGARIRCEKLGFTVTLPEGFTGRVAGGALRATGPDRYRVPVVLEIIECPVEPATWSSRKGWSKPLPVKIGWLEGLRAERETVEERRRLRTREDAYGIGGRRIIVRLRALAAEFSDWEPHFHALVSNLAAATVTLKQVLARLGVGFDAPPGDWEMIVTPASKAVSGVGFAHRSDPAEEDEDAQIGYFQIETKGGRRPRDRAIAQSICEHLGGARITQEPKATTLGELPATVYRCPWLPQEGPGDVSIIVARDGTKRHALFLSCVLEGRERFDAAFDHVRKTFRTNPR